MRQLTAAFLLGLALGWGAADIHGGLHPEATWELEIDRLESVASFHEQSIGDLTAELRAAAGDPGMVSMLEEMIAQERRLADRAREAKENAWATYRRLKP